MRKGKNHSSIKNGELESAIPNMSLDKVISQNRLLRADEEKLLVTKFQQTNDQEAKRQLIESNLRLVMNIARLRQRATPDTSIEDLLSVGVIGLLKAIEKFDVKKGLRLSTYATWWIKQAINRYLESAAIIRRPAHINTKLRQLSKARDVLEQELKRSPTSTEIANKLGWPSNEVADLISWDVKMASLDLPTEGKNSVLADFIEDPTTLEVANGVSDEIWQLLDCLTKREYLVIVWRFGMVEDQKVPLKEVARRLDISRERARQLETNAIKRLKKAANGAIP